MTKEIENAASSSTRTKTQQTFFDFEITDECSETLNQTDLLFSKDDYESGAYKSTKRLLGKDISLYFLALEKTIDFSYAHTSKRYRIPMLGAVKILRNHYHFIKIVNFDRGNDLYEAEDRVKIAVKFQEHTPEKVIEDINSCLLLILGCENEPCTSAFSLDKKVFRSDFDCIYKSGPFTFDLYLINKNLLMSIRSIDHERDSLDLGAAA